MTVAAFDTPPGAGENGGMKKTLLTAVLLCAAAGLVSAQAPARAFVVNYAGLPADVRIGEDAAPAASIAGVAPAAVSPFAALKPGSYRVYFRAKGASGWQAIAERVTEGETGGPQTFAVAAGGAYAVGITGEGDEIGAFFQELAVPAGKGPKVAFTATRMGPPRSATVASAQDAGDGVTAEEVLQNQLTGFLALPSSGKRSVFWSWPAFYESLTHFLPDVRVPTKPAVVDFQDGGYYAVVLERFDENGAAGSVTALGTGAPASPQPAAPAPVAALTAVPATWNGNWALEIRPTRKELSIHDGKIYLVAGTMETETFPGTTSRQYSFTYAEREVATLLGGKPYEKFVLSADGAKITHTFEGRVEAYVRMAK
jgi:hypothetical protein